MHFVNTELLNQLFALWTYGSVEVYFQWLAGKGAFSEVALRRKLARRLNTIDGVAITEGALDKRPSFPLTILETDAAMDSSVETMNWRIEQLTVSEA